MIKVALYAISALNFLDHTLAKSQLRWAELLVVFHLLKNLYCYCHYRL